MAWEKLFTKDTMRRGAEYLAKNRMDEPRDTGRRIECRTLPPDDYSQVFELLQPGKVRMSCTCPPARDGYRCKHMVALAMLLDSRSSDWETRSPGRILSHVVPVREESIPLAEVIRRPVHETDIPEDDYRRNPRAMDPWMLLDRYRVTPSVLEKAEENLKTDLFFLEVLRSDGVHVQIASRQGEQGSRVRIAMGGIECNCRECRGKTRKAGASLCVRSMEAMLFLLRNPSQIPQLDTTDRTGQLVCQNCPVDYGEYPEPERIFSLRPGFTMTSNGLSLQLRLEEGSRKWNITNIRGFLARLHLRTVDDTSAEIRLDYYRDQLDEPSRKLARILYEQNRRTGALEDWMADDEEELTTGGMSPWKASNMRLIQADLDMVYEACRPLHVDMDGQEDVPLLEGELHPFFFVTPEKDSSGFAGVRIQAVMPRVVMGSAALFFFRDGCFWRDSTPATFHLRHFLGEDGQVDFLVGRPRMADVMYGVLPAMRKMGTVEIEEEEWLSRFVPPRPEFTFLLDAGPQRMTCILEAAYDGERRRIGPRYMGGPGCMTRSEEDAVVLVKEYFPAFDPFTGTFFASRSVDQEASILSEGVARFEHMGIVKATDAVRKLRRLRPDMLHLQISVDSDLMNISLLGEEVDVEDLKELLGSFRQHRRYHRLRSGEIVQMDVTTFAMLDALVRGTQDSIEQLMDGGVTLPMYRIFFLEKFMQEHYQLVEDRDRAFARLLSRMDDTRNREYAVPAVLEGILRPYQVEGFRWLCSLMETGFGGILADEMGLGKTLQAIAMLEYARQQGWNGHLPSLVVCPASLIYNWRNEVRRFAPEMKCGILSGPPDEREEMISRMGEMDVVITSYDLFRRDLALLRPVPLYMLILDEAQNIKNSESKAAKAAKVMNCRGRLAMTGTPMENRLKEMWSIFDFLMPGFLFTEQQFREEFEIPIVKEKDEECLKILRRMVAPFIMRRRKKDVLHDLPDKVEESVVVEMEGRQRSLYNAHVALLKKMVEDMDDGEFARSRVTVLAALMKLRQICCDPALVEEGYRGSSAKRDALRELLGRAMDGGHKVLLFSQFTAMLDIIESDLKKENIHYYRLDGTTPKNRRIGMVNSFNQDEVPVFLISLRAGGTGLNLTGADIVIQYDPWWNRAVMNQAADRAHRIGQTRQVTVYHLIGRGTIEERILSMQSAKEDLAESVLAGDTGSFNRMTRRELMELLTIMEN